MITGNHAIPPQGSPDHDFDTIVVSEDHTLFRQFSSFLREFEPDRKALLADRESSFNAFGEIFDQCDVMICDIRSANAARLGVYAVEHASAGTLSIGLVGGQDHPQEEILRLPQNLRFAGFIDNIEGWRSNWDRISAIRQAWRNPLMVSRIEEVPICDILQLVSSGKWNVTVHIEGYRRPPDSPAEEPLRGCISFCQGEPLTAWSWRNAGIEAVFDLLSFRHGVLQVLKNRCTPVIRNIFLHTEEILLSHAVALDESAIQVYDGPNNDRYSPSAPGETIPESATSLIFRSSETNPLPAGLPGKTSWWTIHGKRVIEIISTAQPRSFLLRWMSPEELRRVARDRKDAEFFTLFGRSDALAGVFDTLARDFSSEKLYSGTALPVMRLGRSKEACLYITGCTPSFANPCTHNRHAALLGSFDTDAELTGFLRLHLCASLLMISDHEFTGTYSSGYPVPVRTLRIPDPAAQNPVSMLRAAVSTIMNIESGVVIGDI